MVPPVDRCRRSVRTAGSRQSGVPGAGPRCRDDRRAAWAVRRPATGSPAARTAIGWSRWAADSRDLRW